MTVRLAAMSAAVCCVGFALTGPAVRAQESYKLVERRVVGETYLSDQKSHLTLTVKPSVQNNALPPTAFTNDEQQLFRVRTTAVDAKGRVTAEQRTYLKMRAAESQGDNPVRAHVRSLEGKTITLKVVGSKTKITSGGSKLSGEDRTSLSDALQTSSLSLFPDHPVKVGDTWTVEGKEVARAFSAKTAKLEAKFVAVEPYHGYQCARLHVVISADVPTPGVPAPLSVKLEGELYHAIALHHTIGGDLSGPLQGESTMGEGNQRMTITMNGTMKLTVLEVPAKGRK